MAKETDADYDVSSSVSRFCASMNESLNWGLPQGEGILYSKIMPFFYYQYLLLHTIFMFAQIKRWLPTLEDIAYLLLYALFS